MLPFSQENYILNILDPNDFRKYVDDRIEFFPELYSHEIAKRSQISGNRNQKNRAGNALLFNNGEKKMI